jgi:hypothetical protein
MPGISFLKVSFLYGMQKFSVFILLLLYIAVQSCRYCFGYKQCKCDCLKVKCVMKDPNTIVMPFPGKFV